MSDFGELYLRSTRPHLTATTSAREADYLRRALAGLTVPGPIADLGCGHGRHAARLAPVLGRPLVGFELDAYALREREPGFPAVQADFFALPLRDASLAGAYAWYSSLFSFTDERERVLFAELARVLAPGAPLIFQTVPYERVAASSESSFETTLPDGSELFETARFDRATGRDQIERRLKLPDGRELSARFFIRYHPLEELGALLAGAGFQLASVHGDLDGGPLRVDSTDLIVTAIRRPPAGSGS